MKHEIRWTVEKIARRLKLIEPLVYRSQWPLPSFKYKMRPVGEGAEDAGWQPLAPFQYWGRWNSEFVLQNSFSLPAEAQGQPNLALFLPLGESGDFSHPEALAYADGALFASCDRNHQELALPPTWQDGKPHTLALHGWCGLGGMLSSEPTQLFMRPCQVVQIDQPTRELAARVRVALGIVQNLDLNHPARARILNALNAAFNLLDTREPLQESFYASLPAAAAALESGLKAAGPTLDVEIVATGHAHIDVAWLWPLAQTRKKAARTFLNVLNLLDNYPEFHFSQSQPQLYEFVRQDFPALFARIQEQVAQQRWEVLGGMWVEADCMVSGAEALARQFLLGRSYFSKHFGTGVESPVLWLPDAFGFCWSLPQLILQAGLKYFFTIKLSWNQYNHIPYDSFWWRGLDGSRVLAHFSTTPSVGSEWQAATYNAEIEPGQVMDTWKCFQQKELHPNLLMSYGFGDGGGGPTREMIENLHELQDFPAAPRLRSGSVAEFFKKLEQQDGDQLPDWNGALYLEYHRGTLTSQSRNKRANRKSEFLLHDAEFMAAAAALLNPAGYAYPHEELNRNWQLVCLNQFHDILPGSSVEQVYRDSQEQYQSVQQSARRLLRQAFEKALESLSYAAQVEALGGIWVANPTGFKRADPLFWQGRLAKDQHFIRPDGSCAPCQVTEKGAWLLPGEVAPYGLLALRLAHGAPEQPETPGVQATPELLENDYLRVEFNASGDIVRIYDKTSQREVLPDGGIANQFQAFEDRPLNWDAWDIDKFYDDRQWLSEPAQQVRVLEAGPLRATLEIKRRILHSDYVQHISLSSQSAQLDFSTTIQWREKHILLKVAFPVDVLAIKATHEIQWGNMEWPTHQNTSWDWARFETCAHKWVDLSEGGYGVSLLNDCKYGHDIHGQLMRISLLRSPTMPDPHADEGEHTFAYSLLPHSGSWDERTVAAAYALNDPWLVAPLKHSPIQAQYSLLSVDQPNVVIETIKMAEDGRGLIVRFYENQRRRCKVTLHAAFDISNASQTDLLENAQTQFTVSDNQVQFEIHPYQMMTLRLQ